MPKVTGERARRFPFRAALRAVMVASFCLAVTPPQGSPSTLPLSAPAKVNRWKPQPNIFEFAQCDRLSEQGGADYGDCASDIMRKLRGGKESFKSDMWESPDKNEENILHDCKQKNEFCDVVKIKETDKKREVVLELTVLSFPDPDDPRHHPHRQIQELKKDCTNAGDLVDCRDGVIEFYASQLREFERSHQNGR